MADDSALHYGELNLFDQEMIHFILREELLNKKAESRWLHQDDKVIIYNKGDLIFVFNFHPTKSFEGYFVPVAQEGTYQVVLSTDEGRFGGFDRVDRQYCYEAMKTPDDWVGFACYLPSRCAMVFQKM